MRTYSLGSKIRVVLVVGAVFAVLVSSGDGRIGSCSSTTVIVLEVVDGWIIFNKTFLIDYTPYLSIVTNLSIILYIGRCCCSRSRSSRCRGNQLDCIPSKNYSTQV
jgi:hypothetical protein